MENKEERGTVATAAAEKKQAKGEGARFVLSRAGFYCMKCKRKSVDFTHVLDRGGIQYCPKDDVQMERMAV